MSTAKRLSRRDFLRNASLTGLSLALAGCVVQAPAQVSTEAEVQDVGPSADEPVTLRALWVSQTALVEYFENYTQDTFSEANNGSTVEFELAPVEEFPQKILSGIASGNPPDIFRAVNVQNFAQFALNDVILPLDELIAGDNYQAYLDTFIPGSLETFNINGTQYGIPFGAHPSSQYLFYNKTAFDENGITLDDRSWTWAEYAEVAKQMADPENQVFGAWIRANFEGYMVGVRSMGGDLISEDGTKSLVASEEAWRFWQLVHDLINVDGVVPQPTDVDDWKPPFAASKIMMANDNGYRESFLRELVEDFEFDTFLVPNEGDKPRGGLVADTTAIASASENSEVAWAWIKGILETEQGIRRVQEARFIPLPTEAALLAPEAMVSPQYEFYVRQWIENPPLPAPTPANGRATEMFNTLQSGLEAAWLQTEPLEVVIERVDQEIQAILDKSQV